MLNFLISWINGGFLSLAEHNQVVGEIINQHNHDVAALQAEIAALKKKAADAIKILQS